MSKAEKRPVVMIGVPCYNDVAPELLEDWMRFAFHCGRRLPEFDFFIGIKTKMEQFRARNAIVDNARRINADWLLMLDDDMIINPYVTSGTTDAYDLIKKLMAHGKDICGALYYQRGGNCSPVLMTKMGNAGYRFLRDDEVEGKLQQVDVAGGGCLLINMRIFDYISSPYFEPEYEFGTDVQLCRKATAKGYSVFADTSIELGHLRSERSVVTSATKARVRAETGTPGETRQSFVQASVFERLLTDGIQYTGFRDMDEMTANSYKFLQEHKNWRGTDLEWYRKYPRERVGRQIWYNTMDEQKNAMTTFILQSVDQKKSYRVLDFGCGIGIPAFTFAEQGHRVTAIDLDGTGTLDFLRWRSKTHGVKMDIRASAGEVHHFNGEQFDIIVVMDCLEHIKGWREQLHELAKTLIEGGVMFCNNGILADMEHPEHYPLGNKEFITACMEEGLMPVNQITFAKQQGAL